MSAAATIRAELQAFGETEPGFAELAVVITGCRIYPTVKRALLKSQACELLTLDF